MTEGSDQVTVQLTAPSGVTVLAALVAILAVALVGPAAASAPALSCAAGDPGVHYTAPSNLTVADASNATVDSPFAGNESIAVGDVNVSAEGTAFARVETATGQACLSDVDATAVPVTVETDAAAVTVEGSVDAFTFDDPAADDVAVAYRASAGPTFTLSPVGFDTGSDVVAVDAASGDTLSTGTVSADDSLTLDLPASEDGTRVELRAPSTPTPTESSPTESSATEQSPTGTETESGGADTPTQTMTDDDSSDGGFDVPVLLLIALLVLAASGLLANRRRG